MEFVSGEENESDLLTKILYPARIRKLTQLILGHRLVRGLGYKTFLRMSKHFSCVKFKSKVRKVLIVVTVVT